MVESCSISVNRTQAAAAYFFAQRRNGSIETAGDPAVQLGNPLPALPGRCKSQGIFAQWTWDGESLTACNDRYGMFQMYYFCADDRFAISPSVSKLVQLGAATELDAAALSLFFRLGYFVGQDTPFRHIKVMGPDTELCWSGRLTVKSSPEELGSPASMSREQAIDAYIELFRHVMQRHDPGPQPFVTPLSGGKDSRHILLELLRMGRKPQAVVTGGVYAPRVTRDPLIAAAMAQAAGLRHIKLASPPRFEAEIRKNILTNFCSDEHTWAVGLGDYLQEHTQVFFDGLGGDVLSQMAAIRNPVWVETFRRGRYDEFAQMILDRGCEHSPACLFEEEIGRVGDKSEAKHLLVNELKRYADCHNPICMFSFWNKVRRELSLSPFGVISPRLKCFCPYLDHELFEFLITLPVELLATNLHNDAIKRAYPQYSEIPFVNDEQWRPARVHHAMLLIRLLALARRSNPGWLGKRRLAARWWRFATQAAYRKDNHWLNFPNLLYALQLDKLAQGRHAA